MNKVEGTVQTEIMHDILEVCRRYMDRRAVRILDDSSILIERRMRDEEGNSIMVLTEIKFITAAE